ncbi:hypothetical protein GGI20_001400 [Coemansia sp. BCRC 34301]|nr:hypothetical protein GGI20_001400 [Coemansia sp. BCRC 34301]
MEKHTNLPPRTEFESENATFTKDGTGHDAKPVVPASDSGTGLLGRIALSAAQLAGSVSQVIPELDSNALSEAKLRRQEEPSTSLSGAAQGIQSQAVYSPRWAEPTMSEGSAASAFRQHMRANTASKDEGKHSGGNQLSTKAIDHKGKEAASVDSSDPGLGSAEYYGGSLHQIGLAQRLDGQDVARFLSQTMPASMSTGLAVSHEQLPPLPEYQRQSPPRVADPVAYLQGTNYAVDMELLDHQVPHNHNAQGMADGQAPTRSPGGASRGWDEHGASVLEEWQLNEAWDRAWMDTTWGSAQKRAPAEPRAEPVQPSNRNLSHLLKPRI